ncbi:hypothetical protein STXM2123_891 [Streptomyces sp. F-3]|nr:hypothetical protein STXM2123_891 [Streptomyces sp. F-3]
MAILRYNGHSVFSPFSPFSLLSPFAVRCSWGMVRAMPRLLSVADGSRMGSLRYHL